MDKRYQVPTLVPPRKKRRADWDTLLWLEVAFSILEVIAELLSCSI